MNPGVEVTTIEGAFGSVRGTILELSDDECHVKVQWPFGTAWHKRGALVIDWTSYLQSLNQH